MAAQDKWAKWEKQMQAWMKALCKWQKENPEKDWMQQMGAADDGPGSNPPPPPPPPPPHG